MKKTFSNILLALLMVIIFSSVTVVALVPKAILIDRILMEKGIFLVGEKVVEGFTSISIKDAVIYSGGKKIISFDSLKAGLVFGGLGLEGKCGKGSLEAVVGLGGNIRLKAREFTCAVGVEKFTGDISMDSGIRGRAILEGIDTGVVTIDRIDLVFRGKTFEGKVLYGKFEFEGKGDLKIKRGDLLGSSIRAEFTGPLGRMVIGGTLRNPSVRTP